MNQRANIVYPTTWVYKIIARDKTDIVKAVTACCSEAAAASLKPSKSSKKGSFISMELSRLVHSDEERQELFHKLCAKEGIKMVL